MQMHLWSPIPVERTTESKNGKNRAHLTPDGIYKEEQMEGEMTSPCESPAVMAIRELYCSPIRPGVVNVLYDEPGTGKSMAGIAVLEDYCTT